MPAPITDSAALAAAVTVLAPHRSLGLDTEFMRERTYYAQLCLLQLGTTDLAVCVDPLAVNTLDPLRPLMSAPTVCKILHAARQDLEVLAPVVGSVNPVFDTQVAAALVGFPAQIGYADLVRELLDVELHKSQTRTDWSRRPLSEAQVEYALDDVRYLLPVCEQLQREIDKLGRSAWLAEELQAITDPAQLIIDPERAWLRVKSLQGLDPDRQRLARLLAAWRERRAIERNRPRGWIIDDNTLRDIIVRVPRTMEQLAALETMPEATARHSGEELLRLIRAANLADPPPPLLRREKPDPEFVALLRRLSDCAQSVAREISVAPEVLATRRDIEALARGEQSCTLLSGWRKHVVGDKLQALL